MEEPNLILVRTRYLLPAGPAEDAHSHRDEPVLSSSEDAGNRGILKSCEVPYDMANREFTRRFNDLARAMRDLSKSYNAGQVIHVRDVMNVRNALHGLEKSVWFDSTTQGKRDGDFQLRAEVHEDRKNIR
jgi:hypothetical protein